jgi:DNA-binding response OmpR family regulator
MNETNGSGRILVVDDEPSIVDAVATALRYEGFDVREEGTGRVFERFYRADDSRARSSGGATFVITLPLGAD